MDTDTDTGRDTAARRYLTDDTLADLARAMVISVADETPGADVIQSPRTAAVPLPILGRCIAGLAEAIQIRLRERDDIDHLRTTVAQLAQALSAIGQITSDHPPDPTGRAATAVMMPPGWSTVPPATSRPPPSSSTTGCCPRTSAQPMQASSKTPSGKTPRACATTPANERDAGFEQQRNRRWR